MASATWRFVLCETPPVGAAAGTPVTPIGELTHAQDRTLELALNRPGSCGFSLSMQAPLAPEILPITRCVMVTRNGVPVWSGPIATIEGGLPDNRMTVRCVGWFELLNYRELRAALQFQGNNPATGVPWKDAEIAHALLALANAQPKIVGVGNEPRTWIGEGSRTGVFQARSKSYQKGDKIGQLIHALSEIEAGFDYSIDPVTRALNLSAWNLFTDRPEVHFGMNWGPSNLQTVSYSIDGVALVNHLNVTGNAGLFEYEESTTSKNTYGVFEDSTNLVNVGESLILKAYAVEEILIRKNPITIYSILPFPNSDMNEGLVPVIFQDYFIGDKIRFSAHYGPLQVSGQAVRIFGVNFSIDSEGNERITSLSTSPQGA